MKLRLSYIGINTDNPTPILIAENGMAVTATKESLENALHEARLYENALYNAFDKMSSSTIDPNQPKQ